MWKRVEGLEDGRWRGWRGGWRDLGGEPEGGGGGWRCLRVESGGVGWRVMWGGRHI